MTTTFEPTHATPREGMPTWPEPDGTVVPGPALPGLLPVAIREQRGVWTLVECSNGWTGWVDGSRLATLAEADAPAEQREPVRLGKVVVSVPLLGGIAIVVSSFLAWFESQPLFLPARSAHEFPLSFLNDKELFDGNFGLFRTQPGGTSIGTALVVLGLAVVVLSQTKVPSIVTRIIGVVVLVMSTLFLTQMQRGMGQLVVARVFSVLGPGVYVAAVSGLVVGLARGPYHRREDPT